MTLQKFPAALKVFLALGSFGQIVYEYIAKLQATLFADPFGGAMLVAATRVSQNSWNANFGQVPGVAAAKRHSASRLHANHLFYALNERLN